MLLSSSFVICVVNAQGACVSAAIIHIHIHIHIHIILIHIHIHIHIHGHARIKNSLILCHAQCHLVVRFLNRDKQRAAMLSVLQA